MKSEKKLISANIFGVIRPHNTKSLHDWCNDSPSKKKKDFTILIALLWELVTSDGGYLW